jgi:hypothetical protein
MHSALHTSAAQVGTLRCRIWTRVVVKTMLPISRTDQTKIGDVHSRI